MHVLSAVLPFLALAGAVSAGPVSSTSGHAPVSPTPKKSTTKSTIPIPTGTPSGKPPAASVSGLSSGSMKAPASKSGGPTTGPSYVSYGNHEASAVSIVSYLNKIKGTTTTDANNIKPVVTTAASVSVTTSKHTTTTTTTKHTTTTSAKHATTTTKKATTTKAAKKAAKKSAKKERRQVIKAVTSSAATTTATTSSSTTTTLQSGCTTLEPMFYTYYTLNTTTAGFLLDTVYSVAAAANIVPPAGYTTLFTNALAAMDGGKNTYLTMSQIASYNTTQCAIQCNNMAGCNSFNIYFQRNGQYTPGVSCLNPPARTQIQCAFYGNIINATTATNVGLWEANFAVVIAGSNGYMRNPPPAAVSGFNGPFAQTGALPITTNDVISYTYLSTYSPSACASLCTQLTATRRSTAYNYYYWTGGIYTPCNSFNMWNVSYGGVIQAYACVMYGDLADQLDTPSTSIAYGGVTYSASYSYTWDLYPQDPGNALKTYTQAPQGTSAACASLAASASTVTDYDGVTWNIACAYNLPAYDIGSQSVTDYYSCFDACNKFTNCNAFAFGWNTCYFKQVNSSSLLAPIGDNYGVDLAWNAASNYAGWSARNATTATVSGTTTVAWTGATTTTITKIAGTSGIVVVQTPGVITGVSTKSTTTWFAAATDSGTSSVIYTTTVAGANTKTSTILTVYPTAPACSGVAVQGANYAIWNNNFMGGQNTYGYPNYAPDYYKTVKPIVNGTAHYMAEDNDGSSTISVFGYSNTATGLAVAQTFYIYAGRGTGYYNFQIPYTDDIEFIWIGNKALTGWTRANADLFNVWTGNAESQVSLGYNLAFGSYLPVRVHWANGGGPGSMEVNMWAPDGSYIVQYLGSNNSTMSPQVVTTACGSSTVGAFPAWGSES
ncbi:hypothetical protein ANO11243_084220 [Dothideomycetidae sp. 11243]|nr:hypothetical protein ANO11243_084220 [fungal sp. No.11243]